jgi:hypothetical protein
MPGPGKVHQKVGRFGIKPMKQFLKNIELMASKRLAICAKCDYWDRSMKRCKKCGCFTSAKARIPQAKCPAGYWGPER